MFILLFIIFALIFAYINYKLDTGQWRPFGKKLPPPIILIKAIV